MIDYIMCFRHYIIHTFHWKQDWFVHFQSVQIAIELNVWCHLICTAGITFSHIQKKNGHLLGFEPETLFEEFPRSLYERSYYLFCKAANSCKTWRRICIMYICCGIVVVTTSFLECPALSFDLNCMCPADILARELQISYAYTHYTATSRNSDVNYWQALKYSWKQNDKSHHEIIKNIVNLRGVCFFLCWIFEYTNATEILVYVCCGGHLWLRYIPSTSYLDRDRARAHLQNPKIIISFFSSV